MTNAEDLISTKNSGVSATVHKNYFKDDDSSYIKVIRDTVDDGNIIADILEHDTSLNKGQLLHFSVSYREAAVRLYAKGYAISPLNLGTIYHSASTNSKEKDEAGNPIIKNFGVGFTPSEALKTANESVEVKEMKREATNPEILSVINLFSGLTDLKLHIGKAVRIKGNRLKLAGEKSGLFFATVGADGTYSIEDTALIKVEKVYTNEPKSLEFFIPDSFEEGKYRIIIRTASGRGASVNKTYRYYVSDEVLLQTNS